MIIRIATDFTDTPGPRYIKDGPFSGEQFREDILLPKFKEIIVSKDEKLTVDFDGGFGYPSSFLEEAFGGLARIYTSEIVLSKLEYISVEEPTLIEEVKEYIRKASAK